MTTNFRIMRSFIEKNNVGSDFIKKFLKTIPDSRKKREPKDLLCKCGNPKKLNSSGRISTYCGNSACWMHFGKKRPEHSKRMKHLAATTDRLTGLMKKGKLHNKEVNTRTFKQKVLSNKGIAYTEESLEREYSRYNTNKNQVTKSKRYASQLRNVSKDLLELLYKKYGPSLELSEEYFESLECIERDELFYDIHGLLTKYYDRQVKISRGSKFQRILMAGLKYNMKVSTLYCRSSYEKQWIRFFEKNKIAWQYEPFTINGKNRGTYTPDFIIDLEGKKVVLEVKGTMYGYPEDYMDNKINACREYCKNKNYRFLYILNKKPNLEVLKG